MTQVDTPNPSHTSLSMWRQRFPYVGALMSIVCAVYVHGLWPPTHKNYFGMPFVVSTILSGQTDAQSRAAWAATRKDWTNDGMALPYICTKPQHLNDNLKKILLNVAVLLEKAVFVPRGFESFACRLNSCVFLKYTTAFPLQFGLSAFFYTF